VRFCKPVVCSSRLKAGWQALAVKGVLLGGDWRAHIARLAASEVGASESSFLLFHTEDRRQLRARAAAGVSETDFRFDLGSVVLLG